MARDIRHHSSDHMTGLRELEYSTEPVAVVVRPDGSLDVYGYVAVVDQTGTDEPTTEAADRNDLHIPVGKPFPGRPGYVTGQCGHAVAGSEWRAGYRVCEHCPAPEHQTLSEFARSVAGIRKDGEGRDADGGDYVIENDEAFELLHDLISDARGLCGINDWSDATAEQQLRWSAHRDEAGQQCAWSLCIVDAGMSNPNSCPAACPDSNTEPVPGSEAS